MARPIFISKPEFDIEVAKLEKSIKNVKHHKHNEFSTAGHGHSNHVTVKQLKKLKKRVDKRVDKIGRGVKIDSLLGLFTFVLSFVLMFIGIKGWNINVAYFLTGIVMFIVSLSKT